MFYHSIYTQQIEYLRKNLIVVDRLYSYSDYEQYHDLEDLNMFFQSKIMDLSLKVESDM